ncbi:MAG: TIGR04282 family arsenosugar biosynthesis glycosyltransferase [Balneolaceae bacterium]|nr:TIGR04282 family arsenosugar biosynthesis glycosyltransferase [Balneolaceae bacterium]
MNSKEVLIIFVKNPREGEVKTRLAKSVGDQKALRIYTKLLEYTRDIVRPVAVDLQVWYSSYIPLKDLWDNTGAEKRTQQGENLGDRMKHAFKTVFAEGYNRAVIIGSDCAQLDSSIIQQAFENLESFHTVIGPSTDGGYYLLGMDSMYGELFEDMTWSTGHVFEDTIQTIKNKNLSCQRLQSLNDVDTIDDWKQVKSQFPNIN